MADDRRRLKTTKISIADLEIVDEAADPPAPPPPPRRPSPPKPPVPSTATPGKGTRAPLVPPPRTTDPGAGGRPAPPPARSKGRPAAAPVLPAPVVPAPVVPAPAAAAPAEAAAPAPIAPPPAALEPASPPARSKAGAPVAASAASREAAPAPSADVTLPDATAPEAAASPETAELIVHVERELATGPDPERALRLRYERARLTERASRDPEAALAAFEEVLAAAPAHLGALRGARRAALRAGRAERTVELLEAEARVTGSPRGRAALHRLRARLLAERLERTDDARAALREALEVSADDVEAWLALERLARRDPDPTERLRALARLADHAAGSDPPQRAAWLCRRASLLELHGDADAAAESYEEAIEADPRAPGAIGALRRLHRAAGRWSALVRVLERERDAATGPATKADIERSIARVRAEELEDGEGAIASLRAAVALTPTDRELQRALSERLLEAGRTAEAAEVLVQRVGLAETGVEKAALCVHLGALFEGPLASGPRARLWYETALDVDPTLGVARDALLVLCAAEQDWPALAEVWRGAAEHGADAASRAEAFYRLGELLEQRLADPAGAVAAHLDALGVSAEHDGAFDAARRLLAAAGRWRELSELLERAVERAPSPAYAIAWLFRVGGIREDHLDDAAGALATYQRVLALAPRDLGALVAVARAAARAGRPRVLVESLLAQAEISPEARPELILRAARALDAQLEDRDAAIRALEGLRAERPEHRGALTGLAELYRAAGRLDDLRGCLRALLADAPSTRERRAVLLEVARLGTDHLADVDGGVEAYREALALGSDPSDAAFTRLAALLRRAGRFAALEALLAERLEGLEAPAERAVRALELGVLRERRLDAPERALEAHGAALAARPGYRAAQAERARLLVAQGDFVGLGSALAEEAADAREPALARDARLALARTLADRLDNPAAAHGAFEEVLEEAPEHLGALIGLAELDPSDAGALRRLAAAVSSDAARAALLTELAWRSGDAGVLTPLLSLRPDDADALERLADHASVSGDRAGELALRRSLAALEAPPLVAADRHRRVAELLEAAGDSDGALAAYEAALRHDRGDVVAARGFSRVSRRAGDPTRLTQAAGYEAEVVRDRDAAVSLLVQAALLRRHAVGDPAGAVDDLRRALELDPGSGAVAKTLTEVMSEAGRIPELVELLMGAAGRLPDAPERALALHLEVAALHAGLRDVPAALTAIERALALDPQRVETRRLRSEYLERAKRWEDAARAWDRVLEVQQGPPALGTHLRLATLYDERLGDPESAAAQLRQALAINAAHAPALARLSRIEAAAGRFEQALSCAQALAQVSARPEEQAAALTTACAIALQLERTEEAAAYALDAMRRVGAQGNAAVLYRRLVEGGSERATWGGYSDALRTFLQSREVADRGAAYVELSRVLAEEQGKVQDAVDLLQEAAAALPGDAEIALALATRYSELKGPAESVQGLRRALARHPTSAGLWRAFAQALVASGQPGEAALALAPLVALAEASDAERAELARAKAQPPGVAPAGILGLSGLRQLQLGGELEAASAELMGALGDAWHKLRGFDPASYGVGKRQRQKPGALSPIRQLVDQLAVLVGGAEVDVYVHDTPGPLVVLEPASPPALMVSSQLEALPLAGQVFLLARPLAALAAGDLYPVLLMDDDELRRIFDAVGKQYDSSHHASVAGVDAERVASALSWFTRKRMQDAAISWVGRREDVASWAGRVQKTMARAGLLASQDLLASLAALEQSEGRRVGSDEVATDLLLFWVDEVAARFRSAIARKTG